MAIIKVLQCKSCSGPLTDGTLKCPHCGMENKIATPTEVNPLKMSQDMAKKYISYFKKISEENPKDENSLFAMGMFYLGLKNYELAKRNFRAAVDLSPMEPDVYYYFSLSLIEGRSPKSLNFNEAKRIEEWLCTAVGMQRKRKYLILLMFLRQGAFVSNGLQIKEGYEYPVELLEEVKNMLPEPDELTDLLAHVRITDDVARQYLSTLRGESELKQQQNNREEYLGCIETVMPKGDDESILGDDEEILELNDEHKRLRFLKAMWEPSVPQRLSKDSYPVFTYVKRLIIAAILSFVLLFIAEGIIGYSVQTYKPPVSADSLYVKRSSNTTAKLTSKQKKQIRQNIEEQVSMQARKDSATLADYPDTLTYELRSHVLHFGKPAPEELPEVKEYTLVNYKHLPISMLVILLPLLIWLYRTSSSIREIHRYNTGVTRQNKANKEAYNLALMEYNGRPSIHDYVFWCRHFLAGNSPLVKGGDPVSEIMHLNHIDEKDLAGKIFFVNHFSEEDGTFSNPEDILRSMFFTVAIPQQNKLSIFYNRWDTTKNAFAKSDSLSIFYSNISSISCEGDELNIHTNAGLKSIVLPPFNGKCLLEYQSDDPGDKLTYSITRTGSADEFMLAIEKLISSHQDKASNRREPQQT